MVEEVEEVEGVEEVERVEGVEGVGKKAKIAGVARRGTGAGPFVWLRLPIISIPRARVHRKIGDRGSDGRREPGCESNLTAGRVRQARRGRGRRRWRRWWGWRSWRRGRRRRGTAPSICPCRRRRRNPARGGLDGRSGAPAAPDEETPRGDGAHRPHRPAVAPEERHVDREPHPDGVDRAAAREGHRLARREAVPPEQPAHPLPGPLRPQAARHGGQPFDLQRRRSHGGKSITPRPAAAIRRRNNDTAYFR